MNDHATLTCGDCGRPFDASMPLSRARLARSSLMFIADLCPHCGALRSYLKSDFRFDLVPSAV